MSAVTFGALLIPNVAWGTLVDRARRLEELGVARLWVDDHLVNPARPDRPWFDAWTALAGLAGATSTIRLGPLVANPILRHPVALARAALTVDHASGGRLELGLGAGHAESDHRGVGGEPWPPGERSQRFAEAVTLVDRLLRGEATTFAGEYYRADGVRLQPATLQPPRPPLTVAAHGPAALGLAARLADRWVSYGGWGLSVDELLAVTRRRNRRLDELCRAAGRAPSDLGRSLLAGNPAVTTHAMWASLGALEDFVGRFHEAGIDDFVWYYPPESMYRRGTVPDSLFPQALADLHSRAS